MSSIFGNISDTNVYSKKRFLNPGNEYFGTIVNPTVIDGQQAISAEELGYLSGATGNIQDQLDNKIEASDMVTFTNEIDFNGLVSFNDLDTPPHCQAVPLNPNDLCNKAYVDAQAPLTSYQLFCNYSDGDGIPGTSYRLLSPTETYTAGSVAFSVNNSAPVLVAGFFNTVALLSMGSLIPPGNWTLNSYSNVTSINDQAHIGVYFQLVGITTSTPITEIVIASSSVSPLISVVSPSVGTYSNIITLPQTDISGYIAIGIKIYVTSNVSANHTGTMYFQSASSYTSLLTSFAVTQAIDILGTNNTWTGTNTFSSTSTFNNTANFGTSLSISSSLPRITSSDASNDFQISVPSSRSIRLAGNVSLGGTGLDTIVIQSNDSPFNRQVARAQAGTGNFNGLVQAGDNIYIFGNNATAGVAPTAVIGLWGVNAGRVGLRMSTTDYNIEGGTGNMTLRMNNTTAMTINSSAVATFTNTVNASITGNAGTVTNGVYTNQTYNNPPWLGTVDGSKIVGDILTGSIKSPIGGLFGFAIDNDSTNTGDLSISQKNAIKDVKITTVGSSNKISLQPNETEAFYVSAGQVVSRRAFSTIYDTRLNNPVAKFVSSDNAANNAGVQIAADVAADGLYNGLSLTGDHIVFGGNNSVGKIVVGPYTSNRTGIRMTATVTTIEGSGSVSIRANNITAATVDNTGIFTFDQIIAGNISGNAATVTNGVVTTGSYANPSWITSLDASKITGATSPISPPDAILTSTPLFYKAVTMNFTLACLNGFSLSAATITICTPIYISAGTVVTSIGIWLGSNNLGQLNGTRIGLYASSVANAALLCVSNANGSTAPQGPFIWNMVTPYTVPTSGTYIVCFYRPSSATGALSLAGMTTSANFTTLPTLPANNSTLSAVSFTTTNTTFTNPFVGNNSATAARLFHYIT